MIKTITHPHEVVKFIYDEVPEEEKNEYIKKCILYPEKAEEAEMLMEVKDWLDKSTLNPSDYAIRNILSYSRMFR
ncbi:MAG: hypothetical protein NZ529_08795 [Cytophagaceae bacterium]|nr:hypothetical protein [Cytophagaceae bacterium]MDW8456880.1 hypothetical protein [Cytophagaceae bacterium]